MLVQNAPHTKFLMNDVTKQQAQSKPVAFTSANNTDTVSFTAKVEEKEGAETTEKKANKFASILKAPLLLIAKCFTAILDAIKALFSKGKTPEQPPQQPFVEKTLIEKYEPFIKDAPDLATELMDNLLGDIKVESGLDDISMKVIHDARAHMADDNKFFDFIKEALKDKKEELSDGVAIIDAIVAMTKE